MPPALSANDYPGGRTQVLNVLQIKQIDHHPADIVEDSAPESILNTKNWLNWNGDLDYPNARKDDWEADNEPDIELDNGVQDSETPEMWDVSATPNVFRLISPTWRSKEHAE